MDIKKIREDLNYNQEEFAKLVGVSRGTIIRWEKGDEIPEKKIEFISQLIDRHKTSPIAAEPVIEYVQISKSERIKELETTLLSRDNQIQYMEEIMEMLRGRIKELTQILKENNIEF